MADPKHVAILRRGANAWSQWQRENSGTTPNLTGANLVGANLAGANLAGASLEEANLVRANLVEADLAGVTLEEANLAGANLAAANLAAANLAGVNLRRADLVGANLAGANLRRAKLGGANLAGVNLRRANLEEANLAGADLHSAKLGGANLVGVNLVGGTLHRANLEEANLAESTLHRANLEEANLAGANLDGADLAGANLAGADLAGANLAGTNLRRVNLAGANLEGAYLVETNFEDATLKDCRIFGISAWKLNLKGATQADLVISDRGEPEVTVDNLEVAQFIYLLLNNERVRDIINTITTKVVLILGRFTPERKAVLDAIREELRRQNFIPVLFDFDKPASRDLTETISTLAHLARFVIADITDPRSVPQELQAIVPDLAVPVQGIIQADQEPWGMFQDFPKKYHWVLAVHRYRDLADLLASLRDKVIGPAEAKAKELQGR